MEDMALKVLEEIRDLIQERIGEGMRPPQEPGAAPEGVEPPAAPGSGMETGAEDEITDEDAAALSDLYASEGIGEEASNPPPAEPPLDEMDPMKKKKVV